MGVRTNARGYVPPSGTLRLYVDGTNGNDAAAGTSWATAWKTTERAHRGVAEALLGDPTNLRLILYIRGAFNNERLLLNVQLQGYSQFHIVHHPDDMTVVATGTVATIAATSFAHGMRELTFNGWAPTSADHGRWLFFTQGTNKIAFQVLRVSAGTVTISATAAAIPAWLVGGGTVAVSVREPSMSGLLRATITIGHQDDFDPAPSFTYRPNNIIGLKAALFSLHRSSNVNFTTFCDGLYVRSCSSCESQIRTAVMSTALAQEFGLVGTNTSDTTQLGSVDTGSFTPRVEGSSTITLSGRFATPFLFSGGHGSLVRCAASVIRIRSGSFTLTNTIATQLDVDQSAFAVLNSTSFLDLPATGTVNGLIMAQRGAEVRLDALVDGDNTGTGSNLVAIFCTGGGQLRFNGSPSNLKGKHGFVRIVDGLVRTMALTLGAFEGAGPDFLVDSGELFFNGAITKSAVNTSGSSFLLVSGNAKVTQTAGNTFTLATPPGSPGDWAVSYGTKGAIVADGGLAHIRLGTLTGGATGTTGIGCTLKNGSKLVHAGVGLSGVAPLNLGGLPAPVAWPASGVGPFSDMGTTLSQGCWCIPGAA